MKVSGIWKNKRRLWQFAALSLLILSLVVSHVYKDRLLNLVIDEPLTTQITPPPCHLNRASCTLPIITPVASEAPWTFSMTPHPIPVSAPIVFTLTPPERVLTTNKPDAVWVDITGDSMDMGHIRVALQQQTDGQWIGTGSIPVCITGAMRWRARLNIKISQTTLQADWVFTAPESDVRH